MDLTIKKEKECRKQFNLKKKRCFYKEKRQKQIRSFFIGKYVLGPDGLQDQKYPKSQRKYEGKGEEKEKQTF